MSQVDLEEVISDAVSDASLPEEVSETLEAGTEVEAAPAESTDSVETQSEEVSDQEGQEAQSIREVISITINGIAAGLRNTG